MRASPHARLADFLIRLGLFLRHRKAQVGGHCPPGQVSRPEPEAESLSLVVTTFEERFFDYCLPFLRSIRESPCNLPITLVVNGPVTRRPDDVRRQAFMREVADLPCISPLFLRQFSGLARLWNLGIQAAGTECVLCLNDDMMVTSVDFETQVRSVEKQALDGPASLVVVNGSWSSFMISRQVLDAVGWFDERLVGIGEEDGDYTWRYIEATGREPATAEISGLASFVSSTADAGFSKHSGGKYSLANKAFIGLKYRPTDGKAGGIEGMFGRPMTRLIPEENPYPLSRFAQEGPRILRLEGESETAARIRWLVEDASDQAR